MRYLGGKYRIRKDIARVVAEHGGGLPVWEPFCGGLNSAAAHSQPVLCSDVDESLIALYQAIVNGWEPPSHVSEDEFKQAKFLPPSNPLHGFCAFGLTFGGMKWGTYAREGKRGSVNFAESFKRVLFRDVNLIVSRGGSFFRADFLAIEPSPQPFVIYADPPYAGRTGYGVPFDHARFVARVLEWASCGVTVLVSEYSLPIGLVVYERTRTAFLRGSEKTHTERIYLIGE